MKNVTHFFASGLLCLSFACNGDDEEDTTGTATNVTATDTTPTTGTDTDMTTGTATETTGTPTTGETTGTPTTGETTGETGTGTGTGGEEGGYGECDNGMCPGDQVCAGVAMVEGSFCAPSGCDPTAMPTDCPSGPDGTAIPTCALDSDMNGDGDLCALICMTFDEQGECPTDMTCKQLPAPNDAFGICVF